MKILINGKEMETASVNMAELANELSLPPRGVAVAADGKVVNRNDWNDFRLADKMKITIIKAACGG